MLACLSSYFQILEFLEIKFADLNRYTFSSMFTNTGIRYTCWSRHTLSSNFPYFWKISSFQISNAVWLFFSIKLYFTNILFQLPEVKNFIYGDFESKYDRTVFKKIPGKAPEAIFYTQSGKELERLNIERFDR